MYAVLFLPFHGEPTLVASFSSRRELLRAMNLENNAEGWRTARQYERAVYEITRPEEIDAVLREISTTYPDSFEGSAVQIAEWVDTQSSPSSFVEELSLK